jgi:hypothetical protein
VGALFGFCPGTLQREVDAASAPGDRIYTIMSGVFYIGLGDQFDANSEFSITQPL